ncbi:hypothetical protein G7084_06230 [Weissella coleopterorum]|uniref:RNA polymerase sigma-70 region 4 domain-containing protein n=1 Tax=Weissella coleopterorum TaxID=2714949 RepID=A0A6G8B155_9LACO|nr:hypothetical protein [Weissella coleopterorum]QIL50949.1 hypothetical protein G7084_06230 [Weissella coleopterorum]
MTKDDTQVIKDVRYFFNKELPRFQLMAHYSLSMNEQPYQIESVDGASKWMSYSRDILKRTVEATDNLPERQKRLIELRYFKNLEWAEASRISGISTRRGLQLIREAHLMFADNFKDTYDFRT